MTPLKLIALGAAIGILLSCLHILIERRLEISNESYQYLHRNVTTPATRERLVEYMTSDYKITKSEFKSLKRLIVQDQTTATKLDIIWDR